ncbi:MAG: hypothetical protein NVS4B2_23570 [Chloroflexota bacterium]
MSQAAFEKLVDRWIGDPTFREAMRSDPEGTVRRSGADLNQEEWATLRKIDWNLGDEELQSRVNKDGF